MEIKASEPRSHSSTSRAAWYGFTCPPASITRVTGFAQPFRQPPTDGSNIKATVVRLTPEDAHNILSLRNFQRHRRIVQGAAP